MPPVAVARPPPTPSNVATVNALITRVRAMRDTLAAQNAQADLFMTESIIARTAIPPGPDVLVLSPEAGQGAPISVSQPPSPPVAHATTTVETAATRVHPPLSEAELENESLSVCVVCQEYRADSMPFTCRHLCLCYGQQFILDHITTPPIRLTLCAECGFKLIERGQGCPICRNKALSG